MLMHCYLYNAVIFGYIFWTASFLLFIMNVIYCKFSPIMNVIYCKFSPIMNVIYCKFYPIMNVICCMFSPIMNVICVPDEGRVQVCVSHQLFAHGRLQAVWCTVLQCTQKQGTLQCETRWFWGHYQLGVENRQEDTRYKDIFWSRWLRKGMNDLSFLTQTLSIVDHSK